MMTGRMLAMACLALVPGPAQAAQAAWTSSWGTAQPLAPVVTVKRPPPPAQASQMPSPILPTPAVITNQTVRMILRSSVGGGRLRLELSNALGSEPLTLGQVHIALHGEGAAIIAGTDHRVTFGGKVSTTIQPGAVIVSDPVDLAVAPLQELAVSLYVPGSAQASTVHMLGLHDTYVAEGDVTAVQSLAGATTNRSYFWLTGLDVMAPHKGGAIVAFGDSITDGYGTSPGSHHPWPDLLARRLQAAPATAGWSVINMGISGNRVRREGAGQSALARFDRDVLTRSNVAWVILLEGVNDINVSAMPGIADSEHVTADQMIEAYSQLVERAHQHGIKVMGATITPEEGLWLYGPQTETLRRTLNAWIRASGHFDALVDFDAAVRDPLRPTRLRPEFDPGDHIHPNDKGNEAMARAIDIGIFAALR
jgi:lysophospholipase L1-like esterase